VRPTSRETSGSPRRREHASRRYQVLLVDAQDQLRPLLKSTLSAQRTIDVYYARSLAQAHQRLARGSVDIAMIDTHLPDGCGIDLAEKLAASQRIIQTMLVTTQPDIDTAVRAIRAGVADFLTKPIDARDLVARLSAMLDRQDRQKAQGRRLRRLRELCKQLNEARMAVSEQVEVLCADLVSAYHDLASQMEKTVQFNEYAGLIRDELDLEQLLSRTLEYLVEKAGPTNALVFLPSGMSEFSVGAYVNYDGFSGAEMLRDHLAEHVAPQIAEADEPVFKDGNLVLDQGLDNSATWLEDKQVLGVACKQQGETLAVLLLFRHQSEPFDEALIQTTAAMAPLLAEALSRVIRVHHRAVFEDLDDGSEMPW